MKFIADENCDFSVVRAPRQAGYDVLAIAKKASAIEDSEVIKLSFSGKRVLLTEDKDFGQLVHAHGRKAHAVILVGYPAQLRKNLARDIVV
jgi:predicted nuclease of predicted toxin-antitoxin system